MAGPLDIITGAFSTVTGATAEAASGAVNTIRTIGTNKYQFGYDVFPENLGSSQYGHFMTMTALTATSTGTDSSSYSVGMFIPSGESGSGIIYESKHEYADIKIANLMGSAIGAFAGGSVGGGDAGLIPSYFGHPINPGVEVLYRNTNLREFQFAFLMAPSSEKESQSMQRIIYNLRRFAAPDLNATTSMLFNTPAEFEIKFYNKGAENLNIPKIKRCVLTDIMVDYTPQGEWSTFQNGHPVSCRLALAFKEMEIIHRKYIEDGF